MGLFLQILFILAVAAVGALWWFGVFPARPVTHDILDQSMILYREFQGSYEQLNSFFEETINDLRGVISPDSSTMVGIFFDEPHRLFDKTRARCAIGFILKEEDEKRKGQTVVSSNPGKYKTASIPKTMSLKLVVPYRGALTLALIGHFWERVKKQFFAEGLKRQPDTPAVEVYNMTKRGQKTVQLFYPLENFKEITSLSTIEKPPSLELNTRN
jgi:hypothetical protein